MAENTKKPATAAEFENYIKNLVYSYENKLSDQKDRIFTLVEENKNLYEELEHYKEKDSQISKTLMVAVQKAKEIEDAAKQKYNMEIERLKIFHHKWVSYYAELKNTLPQDENTMSAEEFLIKMDKILGVESSALKTNQDSEAVAQFLDESKRLGTDKNSNSDFDESAATLPPDNNLDMSEVLSPKDLPELDVLIKKMGILDK